MTGRDIYSAASQRLSAGDPGDRALRWFRYSVQMAQRAGRARVTSEGVVWRGVRATLRPYGGIPATTAEGLERLRGAPPRAAWRAAYSQEREESRPHRDLLGRSAACMMASMRSLYGMGDQRDAGDAWRAYLAAEKAIKPERAQLQARPFVPFNPYEEAA